MPSELKIGDKVEIAGPTIDGSLIQFGKKFIISEQKDTRLYSGKEVLWYPASSLRLISPEFNIGDRVFCVSGHSIMSPDSRLDGKKGIVVNNQYITGSGVKCIHMKWDDNCRHNLLSLDCELILLEKSVEDGCFESTCHTYGLSNTNDFRERLTAIESRQDCFERIQGDRIKCLTNRLTEVESVLSKIKKIFEGF